MTDKQFSRPYRCRTGSRHDKYTFAYALIELRDTYRLSQQDFAKRIGISPQFQCDMESGRRMPSVRIIEKIVKAFGPKIGNGFALRWHRLGARSHGWIV